MRFQVRVPSDVTLPERVQLFELWHREETLSEARTTVFISADGRPHVYVGASNETLSPGAESVLARDEWVCLELSLRLGVADGWAALDVNGTRAVERDGIATRGDLPFEIAVVETLLTPDARDVVVFLDELVVATAPLGCP